MSSQLHAKAKRSTLITFGGTIASGILQAMSLTVLARLLLPVDYGVYAICLSLNALTLQFVTTAVEKAIVLMPGDDAVENAFAPVMLIILLAAPLPLVVFAIAHHLGYVGLSLPITLVLILTQLVNGLGIVPRAMLRRDLRFGHIVGGELAGQFFGQFGMSVLLAYLGFGPVSIAGGLLTSNLISTTVIAAGRLDVLRRIRWGGLKRILTLFRSIGIVTGLEMAAGQSPPFLLGATLGPIAVGLFNRANALIGLPLQMLTTSISRVMISGFAVASENTDTLRTSFLNQLRFTAIVCFPIAAGIAASAPSFTAIVLGKTWLGAEPLVPPIALFSSLSMVCVIAGTLADATRRFREKMVQQSVYNVVAALAIVGFSRAGVTWALYALSMAAMVRLALLLRLSITITHASARNVASHLAPSVIAAAAVFVSATAAGMILAGAQPFIVLSGQIVACGFALIISLMTTSRTLLVEMLSIRSRRPKLGNSAE